jgi:transcriptional regulator with XRE-family HTH domain
MINDDVKMYVSLTQNLKHKLEEQSLSISEFERVAGLRRSAVYNILNGRSKNPSMALIQACAEALGCSVAELLGESTPKLSVIENNSMQFHLQKDERREQFMKKDWDLDYYMKCVTLIQELKKDKSLSKERFDSITEELYYYSHRDNLPEPDRRYAMRLLEMIK